MNLNDIVLENIVNVEIFKDSSKSFISYNSCKGNLNCSLCQRVRKEAYEKYDVKFFNFHYGFLGKHYEKGVVFLSGYDINPNGTLFKDNIRKYLFELLKKYDLLQKFSVIPNVKCSLSLLDIKPTVSIKDNCFALTKIILSRIIKPSVIIVDDAATFNRLTNLNMYSLGRVINIPFWSNEYQCYIVPTINLEMFFRDAAVNKSELENVKNLAINRTFLLTKKILDGQYKDNILRVKNVVYEKLTKNISYETISKIIDNIKENYQFISIDIETTGLSPFEDKITHISISYDFGKVIVVEYDTFLKYKEKFEELFTNEKIVKIFANGHFDCSFFLKNDIKISGKFVDILAINYLYRNGIDLAVYLTDSQVPVKQKSRGYNNLKTLSWIYTDLGGFETEVKKKGGIYAVQSSSNNVRNKTNLNFSKSTKKRDILNSFSNFGLFDTLIKNDFGNKNNTVSNDNTNVEYPISLKDAISLGYQIRFNTSNTEITNELNEIEHYNCSDADATFRIYFQLSKIVPEKLIKFHDEILAPLIFEVLVPQYVYGFKVDLDYVNELYNKYSEETGGIVHKLEIDFLSTLKKEILDNYDSFDVTVLKKLYSKECPHLNFNVKTKEKLESLLKEIPINIASAEQIKNIYKALGYLRETDNTIEASVLKYLAEVRNIESAKVKLQYQNANKLYTTYIKPIKDLTDKDGFLHGIISAINTKSGRLSSENPNLQNIPADNLIRNCFIARPGYKLLDIDYSGIELRVVADLADEDTFINEYLKEDDPDLHWKMATLMFDIPLAKRPKKDNPEDVELVREFMFLNKDFFSELDLYYFNDKNSIPNEYVYKAISILDAKRSFAKTLNFSILYGTTKYGLARSLHEDFPFVNPEIQEMYLDEAQRLIDSWFEKVPKIRKWIEDVQNFVRQNGYVDTLLGRRRWFLFANSNYKQFSLSELRECVNTPVQSLASDICILAAIKLSRFFKEQNEGARIVNLVHDNIISEVPENKVDFYLENKIRIMTEEVKVLRKVPLKVSIKVTDKWEK